jgi:sec-independent protein translocase protein TatB
VYLFIFESIGTQELILIGIVALIFLGPRRLPEIARKLGKMMADFRNTTNEFKSTWEREVDFEEETKAFQMDSIDEEAALPVPRENSIGATADAPEIRPIDKESFDKAAAQTTNPETDDEDNEEDKPDVLSDKRTWL